MILKDLNKGCMEKDTSAVPPDYKAACFHQAVRLLNSTSALNIAISFIFYDSLINSLSISFQCLEKKDYTLHSKTGKTQY